MEEKGWKKKRRNLKTFSSFGGDAAAFVASFSLSHSPLEALCKALCCCALSCLEAGKHRQL